MRNIWSVLEFVQNASTHCIKVSPDGVEIGSPGLQSRQLQYIIHDVFEMIHLIPNLAKTFLYLLVGHSFSISGQRLSQGENGCQRGAEFVRSHRHEAGFEFTKFL